VQTIERCSLVLQPHARGRLEIETLGAALDLLWVPLFCLEGIALSEFSAAWSTAAVC
jgi:hypothetical protein